MHVVAEGEAALDAAVDDVLADVLAGGPEAVRASKAVAREIAAALRGGASVQDLSSRTAALLADRRASAEAAEGLAAFEQRRRPAWVPERGA